MLSGRLVSESSEFSLEDEILLLPGTRFRVVSSMTRDDGLNIIHMKEIESLASDQFVPSRQIYQQSPVMPMPSYANYQDNSIHYPTLSNQKVMQRAFAHT